MEYLSLLVDKTVIFSFENTLYVTSYLLTSMLWLRVLAVIAAASTFPYFYFQEQPLWTRLFWQSMFLLVNMMNLVLLLLSKRSPKLSPEDQELHRILVGDFTAKQMLQILRAARQQNYMADEPLLGQGANNDQLFLVTKGRLDVIDGHNKKLASIGPYEFTGEMSFISDNVASASVIAATETSCYVWDKTSLDTLFGKQGLFKAYLYQLCGVGMADKIRQMNTSMGHARISA